MGMHFFITNHTWFFSTKNIRRRFWWNLICSRTWFCNPCKKKWQCVKQPIVKHISLYGYTNSPSFIFEPYLCVRFAVFWYYGIGYFLCPVIRYFLRKNHGITTFHLLPVTGNCLKIGRYSGISLYTSKLPFLVTALTEILTVWLYQRPYNPLMYFIN